MHALSALQRLCLVPLSLFLSRARRGDTLTFRRAATPCHAEDRRVYRVAVGRTDYSRLLSRRCSRALLAFPLVPGS